MRRTSAAFLAVLLCSGLAFVPPTAAQPQSVWTVFTTVQAEVHDNYAIVDVIADIGNRGPDPEFPFQVLIPDGGFVTGLKVERDGQVWIADVKEKETARTEYEDEKAKEHTAALVEKRRGTQLFAFLVNVAEFQNVRATLRYEVLLAADQDIYNLPLEAPVSGFGQDLGAAFHVRINHLDGVTVAWSDESSGFRQQGSTWILDHSVGARPDDRSTPLNVHYSLPPTPDGGSLVVSGDSVGGVFAHRFRAPPDETRLPLDLVMVLDTSGSMSGQKIAQLRDAAGQVVARLTSNDRIALVPFDSQADTSWGGLRAADTVNRTAAVDEVTSIFAGGGTNIEDGLRQGWNALGEADPERSRIIVFLTDGLASVGKTDREGLLTQARSYDDSVRLFGLAFGEGADWQLVSALAKQHGGSALLVPSGTGAEVDIRAFMAALTTPVLEDVHAAYEGNVVAFETGAPILFAGSELLIIGTYAGMDSLTGTVTGRSAEGPRSYEFAAPVPSEQSPWLPRLVAAATIRHYEDLIHAEGERTEWSNAIKGLALEYGFVTDYTSLVLRTEVDDPESGSVGQPMQLSDSRSGGFPVLPETPSTPPMAPATPSGPGNNALPTGQDDTSTPSPLWALLVALGVALVVARRR